MIILQINSLELFIYSPSVIKVNYNTLLSRSVIFQVLLKERISTEVER